MKCLHCRAEMDMSVPIRHAESYGGSTITVACEKCQGGNRVTLEVVIKYTMREKYRGDKDSDDWGAPMKPNPIKKKVVKPVKMTYDQLYKLVESYNEPAKLMLAGASSTGLPMVMRYVAEDIFLHGKTDSDYAKTIRHQLKHLHDKGSFDL
jgi:hypothetical protein